MQSPRHTDQMTHVGTVDALISDARELRGKVDAVRRDAVPGDDVGDPHGRWRRALCDLAVHHLRDVGERLGQLREEIAPAEADGAEAGDLADPAPGVPVPDRYAHLGRAGSAEWNLVTDEATWSPELFGIFGRDPEDGPLTLDELPSWLFAEDQKTVAGLVTACLVDGRPIDGEFRIIRPDGAVRTVHLVGEPVLDHDGSTLSMWAVVRDVSELRRSERVVRETRDSLQRSRQIADAEHRTAVELQEALLPPWRGPLRFPREGPPALDLAARYLPCASSALIGGDWYDALELPDGGVLLSVGDLTGHGMTATSGMAMLLGALRGMAVAGLHPGPMLQWLNQLLDSSAQPTLGSALCCRYDPRDRTLTWAQAGHPAPVLYRDGNARALIAPEGGALGGAADASYAQRTDQLQVGDVLILHTDGLVARRAAGPGPGAPPRQMNVLAPRIAEARGAQDCVRLVVEEFGSPDRDEDACVLAARVC